MGSTLVSQKRGQSETPTHPFLTRIQIDVRTLVPPFQPTHSPDSRLIHWHFSIRKCSWMNRKWRITRHVQQGLQPQQIPQRRKLAAVGLSWQSDRRKGSSPMSPQAEWNGCGPSHKKQKAGEGAFQRKQYEAQLAQVANLILLDNAVGPVRRDPALLRAVVHHVQPYQKDMGKKRKRKNAKLEKHFLGPPPRTNWKNQQASPLGWVLTKICANSQREGKHLRSRVNLEGPTAIQNGTCHQQVS